MDDTRAPAASGNLGGVLPQGGEEANMGALSALRDVRVRDPAARDQDAVAWRRHRFAERVRREWNPIQTAAIEATRSGEVYNLAVLAELIHSRMGGSKQAILGRLQEFAAMEQLGHDPDADRLVRPGAGV